MLSFPHYLSEGRPASGTCLPTLERNARLPLKQRHLRLAQQDQRDLLELVCNKYNKLIALL